MLTLLRLITHIACAIPLLWCGFVLIDPEATALSADPVKDLEHFLGYTAIIIFCAMFILGIILQIINKNQYQVLRRALGLWAFFWAVLHVASYLVLELGSDINLFFNEIFDRTYLILGATAFIILSIMAITSVPFIKKKLGQRWFTVHQFAYVAIILAAIHYYSSVKGIELAPIIIGITVSFILYWRFFPLKRK
ncbi:sulfoxide reductase heme-binding subunit YedZ [Bisgaardia hudsonensis]|uniref:Protein-methionine-sulfoxide reductase heme-binding subunit MsrQ n=1 Tax=Bisgaardia hudsonensis TaxID=109472 RepID=A0A4R2N2F7_9PAST|nr:protein-methionine-sulfoxide reductase heme-binding subunit MsrQ [Bisgaardia hudsonensis]QLB12469.1 sulfoxide reductase heme-binding subunit YedZ [Bisgaardia hudsonensis]TCP14007.1 sulfoxide reductase heme-binding subunit YedZ [Bisgaardia hudsonensis]